MIFTNILFGITVFNETYFTLQETNCENPEIVSSKILKNNCKSKVFGMLDFFGIINYQLYLSLYERSCKKFNTNLTQNLY